jgi:UDP-glucose 4-epimerase
MKVVVTGGAGFVGTNIIKRLLNDGHKVVSLDNYSSGLKENEQVGCQYFDVDLCEVKDYSLFMDNPDVIFHIAALARIQPSLQEPQHHISNNFLSTLNVLDWARTQGNVPVIYAGSSSKHHGLYGSPYAWSKFSGEELCKLYSSVYDLPTSICRFYNVYGPHQLVDGPYCTVVGIFQEQYNKSESLTITGNGEQRRDFTHVDDIVDCLVRLIDYTDLRGEEFELGRGVNHSIVELASYFGEKYPTEFISARKGEYDKTLCEDLKAQEMLGWNPTINLDDYIKEWVNETN